MSKTVCQATLPFHPKRILTACFNGGRITSDAGLLLFRALDQSNGFSEDFSDCILDQRDARYVRHELIEMIRQRVCQILSGYEDCNDANTLRSDPMLKTLCERLPESDPDLAGQSTLSRLENAVSKKDLRRLGGWFLDAYVRRLKKRRAKRVLLDLDSTDDRTHGQQELAFYHGYYRSHILHPLLIFDGDTGDLLCALLRPGNEGAGRHIVPVLKRIIAAIRRQLGSSVTIEVRADSGFARPVLYEFCEAEGVSYEIGIGRNARLERSVEPVLEKAQKQYQASGIKQREFDEFAYQAASWDRARRVVAKVEVNELGSNRRFVLTNREDLTAERLYDHYTDRGASENFIKALKNHLSMDRLSCHRFWANQFRLLLHALAYQMFLRLRDYLYGTPWQNLEIETLRRRILKIGARVRETTRRIWVHLSSSYPEQKTFWLVLGRLHPT